MNESITIATDPTATDPTSVRLDNASGREFVAPASWKTPQNYCGEPEWLRWLASYGAPVDDWKFFWPACDQNLTEVMEAQSIFRGQRVKENHILVQVPEIHHSIERNGSSSEEVLTLADILSYCSRDKRLNISVLKTLEQGYTSLSEPLPGGWYLLCRHVLAEPQTQFGYQAASLWQVLIAFLTGQSFNRPLPTFSQVWTADELTDGRRFALAHIQHDIWLALVAPYLAGQTAPFHSPSGWYSVKLL